MTVSWTDVDLRTEVKKALFGSSTDVETDLQDFFDASVINMWSKYKPVIDSTLFFSKSLWLNSRYRGADGHCGISIYEFTSYTTLMNRFDSGNYRIDWEYEVPTGGTSEPMRLGDFRGYCSTASSPFGEIYTSGIMDSAGYVLFDLDDMANDNSGSLSLSDICIDGYDGTPLSEMYMGIYLTNGTSRYLATAEDTIENSGLSVKIKVAKEGDWLYAPFLSTTYLEGLEGSYTSGTFVSCGIHLQDIEITSSSSSINDSLQIQCYWSDTNQITYSIYITNTSSTTNALFTKGVLYIYGDDDYEALHNKEGEQEGSKTLFSGTLTLGPEETSSEYTGTISIDSTRHAYFGAMVSFTTPLFTSDIVDIDEDPSIL